MKFPVQVLNSQRQKKASLDPEVEAKFGKMIFSSSEDIEARKKKKKIASAASAPLKGSQITSYFRELGSRN